MSLKSFPTLFIYVDSPLQETECSTPATIKNLGWMAVGLFLNWKMERSWSHSEFFIAELLRFLKDPPADPLHNFELIDGKKVLISYDVLENYASTCMAGHVVKINCIQEVPAQMSQSDH